MSILTKSSERSATSSAEDVVATMLKSIGTSERTDQPYPHWFLRHCLPQDTVDDILQLPFIAPDLGGVSGKRELHNNSRTYFDAENRDKFPACEAFAEAFQDKRLTDRISQHFGTNLAGSYLRIEYAQDTDGFWLEPHSDLGVKLFTMLIYMSPDESHRDLGTDIYDADKKHVGRSPFESNAALVFVPSKVTFHGFEKRPVKGVRKSLIVNYVTNEWRAREQLAFPESPLP